MPLSLNGFIDNKPVKSGFTYGLNRVTAGPTFTFAESLPNSNSMSSVFSKLKEVKVLPGGSVRVSMSCALNDAQYGETQIYVNGQARGTLRTTSNGGVGLSGSFITTTQDITINAGDLVQAYGRTNGNIGTSITVRDFIIRVNESPLAVVIL